MERTPKEDCSSEAGMREDRTAAMGLGELRGEKQRLPSRRRAAMAIAAAGDR